jgi:hypothetical protein
MMQEVTTALQKSLPDVDSSKSPLHFLGKDMAVVRTHMATVLQAWQFDIETVYFEDIPQQITSTKRLQTGMIMINEPEPYIVDDLVMLPLSLPQSEIQSSHPSAIQSREKYALQTC